MNCSHHRCSQCSKNTEAAGGLLFACESCPHAYCEDCRPAGSRILGHSERFKELGFTSNRIVYIHCSDICNNVAKTEFDWMEPSLDKIPCPPTLDVSEHFGTKVEEALEATPGNSATRLRPRRAKLSYTEPAYSPAVVAKVAALSVVPKVTAAIPADIHSFNPAAMHAARYAANPATTAVSALKLPPLHASAPTARVPPIAAADQVIDLTEAPASMQAVARTASAGDQVIDLTDSVPTSPRSEGTFPVVLRVQS
jgi:hypothetical protein